MNAMTKIEEQEAGSQAQDPQEAVLPAKKKRRGGRYALMLAVPLLLVAGGAYVWATGGRYQETDNANLRQARITVAADTAGRIVEVDVAESAQVKAGDVLFVVDPEPYRIALAQADAALEGARLNVGQLRAAHSQAVAQQHNAENNVTYLQSEFDRQQALEKRGVSTKSSLDQAGRALAQAQDQLQAAREAVSGALAALGGNAGIETDEHPTVQAALAARDKAAYQLAQTTVRAPVDGIVAQASSFKEGQYVSAGSPLFSLVETGDSWVEANFKETQLTNMRVGQTAEVTLDTFPDRPLTATIESIGAGTGAEFSVLPAQNATGNWVKVTQRIPVRLKVEDADAQALLRTGMSAMVSVDTGHARGLPAFAGWFGQTAHAGQSQ
ncbi:MAG: HlyD family secretion protein [Mesorhizobium sp.]|nr:HlyD family secretion protein [Mesorhizobium sp.]